VFMCIHLLLSPAWERTEVRGALAISIQFLQNGRQDSIRHRQNIVVPETQDPVSLTVQPFTPDLVILGLINMLSAIHFDDQFLFGTDKINNRFSDRLLPSKLAGVNLPHAQPVPQEPLGISRIPTQFPRFIGLTHPSPQTHYCTIIFPSLHGRAIERRVRFCSRFPLTPTLSLKGRGSLTATNIQLTCIFLLSPTWESTEVRGF